MKVPVSWEQKLGETVLEGFLPEKMPDPDQDIRNSAAVELMNDGAADESGSARDNDHGSLLMGLREESRPFLEPDTSRWVVCFQSKPGNKGV